MSDRRGDATLPAIGVGETAAIAESKAAWESSSAAAIAHAAAGTSDAQNVKSDRAKSCHGC